MRYVVSHGIESKKIKMNKTEEELKNKETFNASEDAKPTHTHLLVEAGVWRDLGRPVSRFQEVFSLPGIQSINSGVLNFEERKIEKRRGSI